MFVYVSFMYNIGAFDLIILVLFVATWSLKDFLITAGISYAAFYKSLPIT